MEYNTSLVSALQTSKDSFSVLSPSIFSIPLHGWQVSSYFSKMSLAICCPKDHINSLILSVSSSSSSHITLQHLPAYHIQKDSSTLYDCISHFSTSITVAKTLLCTHQTHSLFLLRAQSFC